MKRKWLAVLTAACVLCGCGARVPKAEQAARLLAPPFLLTGEFTFGTTEGSLVLARPDADTATLTLHRPDRIAGLTLSFAGEEVTLSFGEQSYALPLKDLPEGHPLRLLQGLFAALMTETPACETSGQGETVFRFGDGSAVTVVGGAVRAIDLPTGHFSLRVTGLDRTAP